MKTPLAALCIVSVLASSAAAVPDPLAAESACWEALQRRSALIGTPVAEGWVFGVGPVLYGISARGASITRLPDSAKLPRQGHFDAWLVSLPDGRYLTYTDDGRAGSYSTGIAVEERHRRGARYAPLSRQLRASGEGVAAVHARLREAIGTVTADYTRSLRSAESEDDEERSFRRVPNAAEYEGALRTCERVPSLESAARAERTRFSQRRTMLTHATPEVGATTPRP